MFTFLTTYDVPLDGGIKIRRTERLEGRSRGDITAQLRSNISTEVEIISCYKTRAR